MKSLLIALFAGGALGAHAQTLIDVQFPDGTGTNPTFLEIDNGAGGGTSTWTQSTGVLSGNTTSNSTIGAASDTTIDFTALGDDSLTLSVEVASRTGTHIANGMFIGFQQRNNGGAAADLWNQSPPSFGLVVPGSSSIALGTRVVAVGGNDPSSPGRYQLAPGYGIATAASISDGFSMTLTVNSAGWEIGLTGLEDAGGTAITGGSGVWGTGGINDWAEFNNSMRVGVSYQTNAGGGTLNLSRITLASSGSSTPFAITEIDHAPAASPDPTVTLTWPRTGASTYIARYSLDLANWNGDLDDGITDERDENPGDTDYITVTFPLRDGLGDESELFFRIEEGG